VEVAWRLRADELHLEAAVGDNTRLIECVNEHCIGRPVLEGGSEKTTEIDDSWDHDGPDVLTPRDIGVEDDLVASSGAARRAHNSPASSQRTGAVNNGESVLCGIQRLHQEDRHLLPGHRVVGAEVAAAAAAGNAGGPAPGCTGKTGL
jgi:hypothetical protein